MLKKLKPEVQKPLLVSISCVTTTSMTMAQYTGWRDEESLPVKTDLDKKLDPKKKTIQTFNIDAQGCRKTKNENRPMQE